MLKRATWMAKIPCLRLTAGKKKEKEEKEEKEERKFYFFR
jgi:hypothetical protein